MIGRAKARAIPTFFATRRKLSGRNGKQAHNQRKLNNMKTKMISKMQKLKYKGQHL
jgi:hypothetical protein